MNLSKRNQRVLDPNTGDTSWKKNKDGFINMQGYFSFCEPDWRNKSCFFIMQAPRNMGKSHGTWDYIENEIWLPSNYTKKIGYCRTNKEKLKTGKESFNSNYRNKNYWSNDLKMYKVEYNENGSIKEKSKVEIGSMFSLKGYENYKSGIYHNYVLFFWDEYNEAEVLSQWANFCDLLKTVKRQTEPFMVLLVGNKVNGNNDILVNLGVDLKAKRDLNKDFIFQIDDGMFFIEIGNETFKDKNPNTDIVNRISSFNEDTDRYMNEGGYLQEDYDNVILYSRYVEPTSIVKQYFVFDDRKYEYGSFIWKETDEEHYYIREIKQVPVGEYGIALNVLGDMTIFNSGRVLPKDVEEIAKMLLHQAKYKKLWYCSVDAKINLERFILFNSTYQK